MGNMLKYEWRHLMKKKSLYICLLIVLSFILLGFMDNVLSTSTNYYTNETVANIDKFRQDFSPEKYAASMCGIFRYGLMVVCVLAIFTSMFVCENRHIGTIKNIYSKGYSRFEVYFSEYIISTVSSAIIYISVIIFSFVLALLAGAEIGSHSPADSIDIVSSALGGYTADDSTPRIESYFLIILGQLVAIIAINSMCVMVSQLFKNNGAAIAMNLFMPIILLMVFQMIVSIIYSFDLKDFAQIIGSVWIYTHAMRMVEGITVENYTISMLVMAGYAVLFFGLGLLVSSKREIKG